MLQAIDVINDIRGQGSGIAGHSRRRGGAFGDTAQRRRVLKASARALEAVVVLWSAVLIQLGLVGVHGELITE